MTPAPERDRTSEAGSATRAEARAESKRLDRIGWRLAGVGWEFSSQVLAGVLLGWGIDWFFETKPWGIVGGAAAGLSVGTLQFIRHAVKLNREMGPVATPRGGWKQVDEPKPETGPDSEPNSKPDSAEADPPAGPAPRRPRPDSERTRDGE